MLEEISAIELADRLAGPDADACLLVDVREQWEWDRVHIEGARLIPMNRIPLHLSELPDDKTLVLICHHGVRSYQVGLFLRNNGFERVLSLRGGMEDWAVQVDPSLARY
ncbi:rhodanese-like domain-containing protein [Paludibacterium yongneupense]|uniref:rhodanese-like domain-containing protein n=1 Tax=Paludibacterium yongneupense TaxID=400061 RepID=UPI00040D8588|nr:rhodanese-like domain-containing protein [Paludibacterium yongneupense]